MFSFQSKLSERQYTDLKKQFGITKTENNIFIFSSDDPLRDLSLLQKFKKEENLQIEKLNFEETTLEEVFIHLIKGDLLKWVELKKIFLSYVLVYQLYGL